MFCDDIDVELMVDIDERHSNNGRILRNNHFDDTGIKTIQTVQIVRTLLGSGWPIICKTGQDEAAKDYEIQDPGYYQSRANWRHCKQTKRRHLILSTELRV